MQDKFMVRFSFSFLFCLRVLLLLLLFLYLNLPAGEKLYLFKECSISLVGGGHLRFEVRGYLMFRRLILLNFSMLETVVLATIGCN